MNRKVITIISITILSILLWIFVSLSYEYNTSVTLDVEYVDLPEDYAIGESSNNEILMRIKGPGWQLAKIYYSRDSRFLLSPSYQPGEHEYALRNGIDRNAWLSSTIQVTEIEPEIISYKVEKVAYKNVVVIPDVTLEYKDGFGLVDEKILENDSLIIFGAHSIINIIDTVYTKEYEFTDLEKGFTQSLELKQIEGVSFSKSFCVYETDVQKIVDKTFKDVVINIVEVPRRRELLLFPNKISIVVRGGINILGQLDDSAVSASLSFNQAITDTTGRLVPIISIPKNTSLVTTIPNSLGYIIKQY